MRRFEKFSGIVAPLDRANVDTDQIIPKQFLKAVDRRGLAAGLFHDWRFKPDGLEVEGFVLSRPQWRNAAILVSRENFGCGSSREHAVWALEDFGFRAVIAVSFADIFRINCLRNGLLPIVLSPQEVQAIFDAVEIGDGYSLQVDLERQTVADRREWLARFEIDPYDKRRLLEGLDDVALTLSEEQAIAAYERSHPPPYPG